MRTRRLIYMIPDIEYIANATIRLLRNIVDLWHNKSVNFLYLYQLKVD